MKAVVRNLANLEQPWNCPHGRPTMRHLADLKELYRRRAAPGPGALLLEEEAADGGAAAAAAAEDDMRTPHLFFDPIATGDLDLKASIVRSVRLASIALAAYT